MKEYYLFEIFGFTLVIAFPDGSDGWLWRSEFTPVIAFPDGSDGWLWRSEFTPPKSRHTQTDLISLRIVESCLGWVGIEFVFFVVDVLLKWDAPNNASTRRGAGARSERTNSVAPRG